MKRWLSDTVDYAAVKLGTIWALFSVSSWAEAASMAQLLAGLAGFIYSCILIYEWIKKRLARGKAA